MPDRAGAVAYAAAFFAEYPPVRLDRRDIAFLNIANVLIRNSSAEQRLLAIEILESELYPNGSPRGSLFQAITGRKPRRPKRTSQRGGDRFAHQARDLIIVHVIDSVCNAFDYKPTRSRASKDKGGADSGCSIVKDALSRQGVHMSEEAIEKIWNHKDSV
jgi:hypothetical protein